MKTLGKYCLVVFVVLILSSPALASIDSLSVNPSGNVNIDLGESETISATAYGNNIDYLEIEEVGGSSSEVNYNCDSSCSVSFETKISYLEDEQDYRVYAKAGGSDLEETIKIKWRNNGDSENPDAELDISPTNSKTGETVTFDASSSTDNNNIDRYEFDFDDDGDIEETDYVGDGEVTESFDQSYSGDAEVTVYDEAGNSNTASDYYSISKPDEKDVEDPDAELDVRPRNSDTGDSVTFDASDSTDNKNIDRYEYDFDDDGHVDEIDYAGNGDITESFDESYSGDAVVTVYDEAGNSNTASDYYTVSKPDDEDGEDPEAQLDISPTYSDTGETISFDASDSTDNNNIDRYEFDFDNDGQIDEIDYAGEGDISESFNYEYSGNAEVTVYDEAGNSDTASDYYSISEDDEQDSNLNVDLFDPDGDINDRTPGYRWKVSDDVYSDMESVEIAVDDDSTPFVGSLHEESFDSFDSEADANEVIEYQPSSWGLDRGEEYTWGVRADNGDTEKEETEEFTVEEDEEGSLEVTVRDEDYDRLENARVRIKNGEYETERTNNDGEASFNNLKSGDYEVRVKCEEETENRDIYVSEGETEYLNVEMDLESSDNECDGEDGEALDAFFTVSDSSPDTGESVRFDASGSDGNIKEYRWSFPDETRYGRTVFRSFDSEGSVDVRLRVTDTDGNRDSYERTINVRDVSGDVTAVIDASDTDPRVGESVSFDGSGSLGDIKEYRWRFDDGTTRYGTSTVKTFDDEGTEQVQLTVTGDNGDRDTDSVTINVGERERCGVDIEEIEFNDYDESDDEVEASLEISNDGEAQNLEVELFVDNEQVESFDTEIGSGNRRFSTEFADDEGTDVRAEIRTTGDPCGDGFYERFSTYRDDDFDDDDERPEADLDIDPNQADIGEEIDFDAEESMDPDGEIEEYEFDLDGDGDYEVSNDDGEVERSFYYEVDTRAEVRVTDNDGYTDTASERYRVEAENRVSFSNVNIPNDVCAGDNFEVTFDARNIGDDERVLIVEGEGFGDRNSYSTHLEEDEEEEISITFTTDDPGTEEFTIRALGGNSDSIENSIEVLDCEGTTGGEASGISLDIEPTRIRAGEPVKASGYVENTRGRQNVRIEINNRREQEVSTEPDGYYTTTIYPERTGKLEISAETGEQRVSRSLTVLPTVSVGSMDVPDTVFQGDEIEICADVSSQNIPSVVLRSNGEIIESKNEKGEVCFDTVAKKQGEVEYRITGFARGQSSSVSRDITVHESKAEASSFPEQLASIESGRGIVKATVYNNQEDRRTYDIGISGLPETWTSTTEKTVILQPGEEREVFFYLTPREEGTFSPEIEISDDGETVFEETVELEVGGTTEKREISILQRLRNALL